MPNDFETLYDVEIGDESRSGLAVRVKIDGTWHWIPLSQVKSIHRHPTSKDASSIEVATWVLELIEEGSWNSRWRSAGESRSSNST